MQSFEERILMVQKKMRLNNRQILIFILLIITIQVFYFSMSHFPNVFVSEDSIRRDSSIFDDVKMSCVKPQYRVAKNVEEKCSSVRHIMYLKIHKTGSSSIQNLLLRYGLKQNLTFALPLVNNYFGHPQKFLAKMIPSSLLSRRGLVDIFCIHSRMMVTEMNKVLHKDTVWLTSVREPVVHFESMHGYYGLKKMFGDLTSLTTESVKIIKSNENFVGSSNKSRLGINQMVFDLGGERIMTKDQMMLKLKEWDELFDLVMIVEKMDESLILLKHKLCIPYEDVVMFTTNARRTNVISRLNKQAKLAIKDLNDADALLYEYFFNRHQIEVERFGKIRMKHELVKLNDVMCSVIELCRNDKPNHPDLKLSLKYPIKDVKKYCSLFEIPELIFIDNLRKRQQSLS